MYTYYTYYKLQTNHKIPGKFWARAARGMLAESSSVYCSSVRTYSDAQYGQFLPFIYEDTVLINKHS